MPGHGMYCGLLVIEIFVIPSICNQTVAQQHVDQQQLHIWQACLIDIGVDALGAGGIKCVYAGESLVRKIAVNQHQFGKFAQRGQRKSAGAACAQALVKLDAVGFFLLGFCLIRACDFPLLFGGCLLFRCIGSGLLFCFCGAECRHASVINFFCFARAGIFQEFLDSRLIVKRGQEALLVLHVPRWLGEQAALKEFLCITFIFCAGRVAFEDPQRRRQRYKLTAASIFILTSSCRPILAFVDGNAALRCCCDG
ncbi:hypothetical protein JAB5_24860 [Janthinobacterium sp. HH103]|nr:hypothetical protein JAB5_24860 [Janthinobacterium sp. HH103]